MRTAVVALGLAALVGVGGVAAQASGGGEGSDGHRTSGSHRSPGSHDTSERGDSPASRHAKQMVEIAREHSAGMKRWGVCVRAAAKAGAAHPTAGCTKPEPPGWVKHPDRHPGGWPPQHEDSRHD